MAPLLNMYIELNVREEVSPCNGLMNRLWKIAELKERQNKQDGASRSIDGHSHHHSSLHCDTGESWESTFEKGKDLRKEVDFEDEAEENMADRLKSQNKARHSP